MSVLLYDHTCTSFCTWQVLQLHRQEADVGVFRSKARQHPTSPRVFFHKNTQILHVQYHHFILYYGDKVSWDDSLSSPRRLSRLSSSMPANVNLAATRRMTKHITIVLLQTADLALSCGYVHLAISSPRFSACAEGLMKKWLADGRA